MAFPACSVFPKVMLIPDPLTPEEHLDLGMVYEKKGELDLALREYEAAGQLSMALLGRANVLFHLGQYRQAESVYRRLLSGDLAPEAANNLAFMLVLENRNPREAYRLASMAVEEGIKRHLDEDQVRNFKNTMNQAEIAMMNSRGDLEASGTSGARPPGPDAGTAEAGAGAAAGGGTSPGEPSVVRGAVPAEESAAMESGTQGAAGNSGAPVTGGASPVPGSSASGPGGASSASGSSGAPAASGSSGSAGTGGAAGTPGGGR
jgi:hypothetical protein